MQPTSALHKSIFASFPACDMDYKMVVSGTEYGRDAIEAISTPVDLYPVSGAVCGRCVCREIDADIRLAEGASIPRAAEVKVEVRMVTRDRSGTITQAAEWLPKGTYYIDTRSPDTFGEVLSIHGYDALYKANKPYRQDGDIGEWPRSMADVAAEIAERLGAELDSRTDINSSYMMEYPNDLTMAEVLGYIGAAHASNWIMTDAGALRMISIIPGAPVADIGQEMIDWSCPPALDAYTGVTIWWDDEHAFTAGDNTGRMLEVDCPWATQDMAGNILSAIEGYAYQPYEAMEAALDPAVELGDGITANGITSVVGSYDMQYNALQMSTISAPGDRDEDHELGDYQGPTARQMARKVTLGSYYYGASITREKGLQIQKTDGETVIGETILNSDMFAMRALIDGQMVDCIYFDPVAGRYRLAGNVIIDGGLTVETLYAERGDIAELTVDWLDTSRKISRYLAQDTSMDNHIVAHGQSIKMITATVKMGDDGQPLTTQLSNRYGKPLFWQKDIAGATIQDGYPWVDGEQIMTTADDTGFPVIVYQYHNSTKREMSFDSSAARIPYDSYGSGFGDAADPDRGKGFIQKGLDSFDLWFLTGAGEKNGIFIGNDYVEIRGLRKTTAMDFSMWDSGAFSEMLEGGSSASYGVEFDSKGRPVKITDSDGHETAITW